MSSSAELAKCIFYIDGSSLFQSKNLSHEAKHTLGSKVYSHENLAEEISQTSHRQRLIKLNTMTKKLKVIIQRKKGIIGLLGLVCRVSGGWNSTSKAPNS